MLGGGGIEGREVGRTGGREREAGEEGREEGEDRHSNKYISCTNSKENLRILFAKPHNFLCEAHKYSERNVGGYQGLFEWRLE